MNAPYISRIGKYRVLGVLGRGGMGLVYRAYDEDLSREVAIKTVTESFVREKEMLDRFYREAVKTGMLNHPNIVTVYDLGNQDGFPYIVMEYLAGDPLDKVICSDCTIPLAVRLKIIEHVCLALGYAHRNDVIHRDVKPANVIVQPNGVAKLLDFGIARQERHQQDAVTQFGQIVGTVIYMAPERLRSLPFDGRSDIFSTGVMLFELLTGKLPFAGKEYSLITNMLNEEHARLSNYLHDYPLALDQILDRAMAKNSQDRYATADEMAAALYEISESLNKSQVAELFQRAESLAGEEAYTAARDILLHVIRIDGQHLGARQLMSVVQQKLSRQHRLEQVRSLRLKAAEAMEGKRFESAVSYLEEAEKLDPSGAEVSALLQTARGRVRIREQIDGFLRRADGARSPGDFEGARAILASALELDQHDSRVQAAYAVLVQKQEEAANEIEALEVRQRVDRTLSRCRDLIDSSPEQALELVMQELRALPTNERLLTLQSKLEDQLAESKLERVRSRYLLQAREAIEGMRYSDAIKILETCQVEGIVSAPITELLDFARKQADDQQRHLQIEEVVSQVQELMGKESYDAVIELLAPIAEKLNDAPIHALLEKARKMRDMLPHKLDATADVLQTFLRLEQYDDAVRFIELQQPGLQKSEGFRTAWEGAREGSKQERAALELIGIAYAALDGQEAAPKLDSLRTAPEKDTESALLDRVEPLFESRRKAEANRDVSSAIERSRAALSAGDPRSARKVLRSATPSAQDASLQLEGELNTLSKKVRLAVILRLLGIKAYRSRRAD